MKVISLKAIAIFLFVAVLFLYATAITWYNYNTVNNVFHDMNNRQVQLVAETIKPMLETQLKHNLDGYLSFELEEIVHKNDYIAKIDIKLDNKIIASSDFKDSNEQPKYYHLYFGKGDIFNILDNKLGYQMLVYPSTAHINKSAFEYYLSDSLKMIGIIIGLISFAVIVYIFIISIYDKKMEKDYKTMQKKMKQEVADNERKTNMMYQQSRLAQMGEMISNIAHQWRQPLNSIALVLQTIKLSNAMDTMSKSDFDAATNKIESSLQYMSNTITDFRNFYKTNKEKELFTLEEAVKQSTTIVQHSLENESIKLHIDCRDDSKVLGYKNELMQVVVNLIQNSKDALTQRQITEPFIDIKISRDDGYAVLEIEDNAGGIKENIMEHIFDPYFTTKHKDQGTGLGLYISKVIISNNFSGTLQAQNTKDGVRFIIKIKISKGK